MPISARKYNKYINERIIQAAVHGRSEEFFELCDNNGKRDSYSDYISYALKHSHIDLIEKILEKEDNPNFSFNLNRKISTKSLFNVVQSINKNDHPKLIKHKKTLLEFNCMLCISRGYTDMLIQTLEMFGSKKRKHLVDFYSNQTKPQNTNNKKVIYHALSVYKREDALNDLLD